MTSGAIWIPWWVIGGACAAAWCVLAPRKGCNPLGHTILGFVPPLIGVIVAAAVSPHDATPAA